MKKIAIVVSHIDTENKTVTEALVKSFEQKTGEQVECVMIHNKESDFWAKPLQETDATPLVLCPKMTEPFIQPKIKGHIRPYKFHK